MRKSFLFLSVVLSVVSGAARADQLCRVDYEGQPSPGEPRIVPISVSYVVKKNAQGQTVASPYSFLVARASGAEKSTVTVAAFKIAYAKSNPADTGFQTPESRIELLNNSGRAFQGSFKELPLEDDENSYQYGFEIWFDHHWVLGNPSNASAKFIPTSDNPRCTEL